MTVAGPFTQKGLRASGSPKALPGLVSAYMKTGGLMDDCELFRNNESIVNAREAYTEGDDEFIQEWAEHYIEEMNEAYHRLGL
jgi:hypothetical protein